MCPLFATEFLRLLFREEHVRVFKLNLVEWRQESYQLTTATISD
jgi:hypothetical protein